MTDPFNPVHPADLLAGLRELDAAATPVPWAADEWYCSDSEGGWAAIGPHHHAETDDVDDVPDGPHHEAAKADAALIAAMRNALPALLAQLDAQAGEIERLRGEVARQKEINARASDAGRCIISERDKAQARVAELEGLLRRIVGDAPAAMEAVAGCALVRRADLEAGRAAMAKREGGR